MVREKGLNNKANWNWQTKELEQAKPCSQQYMNMKSALEIPEQNWSESDVTTNLEHEIKIENAILEID